MKIPKSIQSKEIGFAQVLPKMNPENSFIMNFHPIGRGINSKIILNSGSGFIADEQEIE